MSETNTVSPLRQHMIEDMVARKLNPHTQRSHIQSCKTWLNGRLIILLSFLLLLSFCHSKPQHIPKRLNVCTVILKPPSQVIVPGMKHLITLPGMPL